MNFIRQISFECFRSDLYQEFLFFFMNDESFISFVTGTTMSIGDYRNIENSIVFPK